MLELAGVFIAGFGLLITAGGILVGIGMTIQKLNGLKVGQDVLFEKVERLQADIKNGIQSRLSEHSGEIDVLRTEIHGMRDACVERHAMARYSASGGAR